MDKWTIGIGGRLKNADLTRVFKNMNSLLVVGNDVYLKSPRNLPLHPEAVTFSLPFAFDCRISSVEVSSRSVLSAHRNSCLESPLPPLLLFPSSFFRILSSASL